MAACPSGPTNQSMKAWPCFAFALGCLAGLTRITPYWLKSFGSPSINILKSFLVAEAEPGASVGEGIGFFADGRIQGGAHAGAGFQIPSAARLLGVDASILPQL